MNKTDMRLRSIALTLLLVTLLALLVRTWPEKTRRPAVEHFENAFDAVGQWEFYS